MWAEKSLVSKAKLPPSQEKKSSSSPVVELDAFPEIEPCKISMVPVTVQFLQEILTPCGLSIMVSMLIYPVEEAVLTYTNGALSVVLSTPGKSGGKSGVSM